MWFKHIIAERQVLFMPDNIDIFIDEQILEFLSLLIETDIELNSFE